MAFLGSLGKAIGLGKFKSRDIIQGIATGVNEQLKDSMDKTDENVSRLAQLRLTKALRNQELDDADLRENLATIKDLAKQVGGIETATYLIQEYGLSGAKTTAEELVRKKKTAGGTIDIPEYIGIEKASGGTVTALDLAKYVTPSRGIPDISDFGDPGIGIASTLFGYGQGALKKRSAADLAASGIDPEAAVITDIPEIKARGLYEWQIYNADSAQGQVAFLQTVRNRLITKINDPTISATEKKALEAEEVAAHAEQDLMNTQAMQEQDLKVSLNLRKPLSNNDIKTYDRNISSSIATFYNIADKSMWQETPDGNQWTGAGLGALARDEIQRAVDTLIPEIDKASRDGVAPADINAAIQKAVRSNFTFRYIGGEFEFFDGMENRKEVKLVNNELEDAQGDKVFPGLPQSFTPNASQVTARLSNPQITALNPTAATGQQQSQAPRVPFNQYIDSQKRRYQDALKSPNPNSVTSLLARIKREAARTYGQNISIAQIEDMLK